MIYIINVAEIISGKTINQTRHYAEIKLATLVKSEALQILHTFQSAWPISHTNPKDRFTFTLIGREEFDLTPQ